MTSILKLVFPIFGDRFGSYDNDFLNLSFERYDDQGPFGGGDYME